MTDVEEKSVEHHDGAHQERHSDDEEVVQIAEDLKNFSSIFEKFEILEKNVFLSNLQFSKNSKKSIFAQKYEVKKRIDRKFSLL